MASKSRLRASPTFSLAHTMDGRPYVAQETEPYLQYWLSERERCVWCAFAGRHGATEGEGLDAVQRLMGTDGDAAERRRLQRTLAQMREAGVLMDTAADTSRYDRRIVDAYVKQRPFPTAVSDAIIAAAGIGRDSRVLDLAGGPGDLALALARACDHVTLMDLSKGFVQAARARAKQAGVPLQAIHESANRLLFHDEALDLITVSQALHWLDDVQVCRGACRLLKPGGSFCVVHAAIEVDDAHPLAWIFGWDSVLGAKKRQPFAAEVEPLRKRLALLFDALDAPEVARHLQDTQGSGGRIVHAATALFVQPRPIDEGYARAFLTDRHIAVSGRTPADFWGEVRARCAAATPQQLQGRMHWALLQFRRGGAKMKGKPAPATPI